MPEELFECLLILGCLQGGILQSINNQPATTIPTTRVGYSTCSVHGGYSICVRHHCMLVAGDFCYPALQGTHWGVPISFCLTCQGFTMVAAVHMYNTLLLKNVFDIGNLYSMVVICHKNWDKEHVVLKVNRMFADTLAPVWCQGISKHSVEYNQHTEASFYSLLIWTKVLKDEWYARKWLQKHDMTWKEKFPLFFLSNHAVKFSYDHASFGFLKKKMLLLTMFS